MRAIFDGFLPRRRGSTTSIGVPIDRPVLTNGRQSSPPAEWPLNDAWLPSRRERQVSAVEPPFIAVDRLTANDPDWSLGMAQSGQSKPAGADAQRALRCAALRCNYRGRNHDSVRDPACKAFEGLTG